MFENVLFYYAMHILNYKSVDFGWKSCGMYSSHKWKPSSVNLKNHLNSIINLLKVSIIQLFHISRRRILSIRTNKRDDFLSLDKLIGH